MGFEFFDRRKEKATAEAAASMEPEVFAAGIGLTIHEVEMVPEGMSNEEILGKPEKVVEFKKTVRGEVQSWKSVGYVLATQTIGNQQILILQAVGLRTDEKLFTVNYALPPIWEEGADYTAAAKDRLDSFKACACDDRGRCKFHGEAMPGPSSPGKWLEADMKRLGKIQSAPLPEAVEILMRAVAEAANRRIVTPAEAAKGMIQ